jgi:hypothetical protein
VAILVHGDPDDPGKSYIFWAIAVLLAVFVIVVVVERII